jgi:hypothetical protein
MAENNSEYVRALRALADFLEARPTLVPATNGFNVMLDTKEELIEHAKTGSWKKEWFDEWFALRQEFGQDEFGRKILYLDVNLPREQVCRKVFLGKRTIPARDEQVVDEFEWQCDDLVLTNKD